MLAFITITSCIKYNEGTYSPGQPPIPSNQDHFWGQRWDTTSRGYEIHLNAPRLTQDQIIRGINVGIAILTVDDSPWVRIPLSYYEVFLPDTVHLSYEALPGMLNVIARTSFEITFRSDVYIEYR